MQGIQPRCFTIQKRAGRHPQFFPGPTTGTMYYVQDCLLLAVKTNTTVSVGRSSRWSHLQRPFLRWFRCCCLQWQSKKSSSSGRRGGKERSGGDAESSSSSRRRRGSKGSRDATDDNPMIPGLGGRSSGNKEGWERSSAAAAGDVNVNSEPKDKDDSYLFIGATAVRQFLAAHIK